MNKICNLAALFFAAVICVSFFLPWISVESRVAGGITRLISGKDDASLKKISGFQIPVLANGPDARLMIGIIKLFNPSVTDADKKSWLVWGIPGLSVVLAFLICFFGNNNWVDLGIGVLGAAIFSAVTFRILAINLDKFFMNVVIAPGLWMILWSYLGIGLAGFFKFVSRQFKKET